LANFRWQIQALKMWRIAHKVETNLNCGDDFMKRKDVEEMLCDIISPLRKRVESSEEEILALQQNIEILKENVLSLNKKIGVLEEVKNGMSFEIKNLKNEAKNLFSFAYISQCLAFGLLSSKINLMENERSQVEDKASSHVDEKAEADRKEEIEETRVVDDHECQPVANGAADKANFDPAWIVHWKISPYNGGTNVLEWIEKFIDYMSLLNEIDEAQKLRILRFYLEGMAKMQRFLNPNY
jgi:hypothetical protein